MAGVEQVTTYRFSWPAAKALFSKRTLRPLYLQGFFGVFPWNVITFWFFTYLEKERGYSGTTLFVTMAAAVLVLAAGYPLGGALGDALFKRNPRGRLIVAGIGVLTGAALHGRHAGRSDHQSGAIPVDAGAYGVVHPLCRAQRHRNGLRCHVA